LIDLGVTKGLLEKAGTWISFNGERLGQGRENARLFLRENTDIRDKLEADLRKAVGLTPASASDNGKPTSAEAPKPAAQEAAAGKGKVGR
jgi:recombination protein RecA